MDDKPGDNVIDMKRSKTIRDMLAGPAAQREKSGGTPEPRAVRPPTEAAEDSGHQPQPREADGLDMDLPEVLDPFPKPDDPYKAHARVSNKPLLLIRFFLKDGTSRGFAYPTLSGVDGLHSAKAGGGPVIVMRFNDITPVEVYLEGTAFDLLSEYIAEHRIRWVRERSGREFLSESAAIITGITFRALS